MRVRDIDFENHQIIVRDAKGENDRATVLPESIVIELRNHLDNVRALHEKDVREGYEETRLPYALNVKYHSAGRECNDEEREIVGHTEARRAACQRVGDVARHIIGLAGFANAAEQPGESFHAEQ